MHIMYVFTTVKGVTKTDILCAVIKHNSHVETICKHVSNLTKVEKKQNKKYMTYLAFTALENEC